ncbi:MAG: hypothetical protein CMN72_16585 [Sphingomonas sp.]|nr:hypothetical protein [Sphingomonas sp.]
MSRSLEDWELWSAAIMVVRQHGDQAPTFVAERIAALALASDHRGIEAWKQIAARIEQLLDQSPAKH